VPAKVITGPGSVGPGVAQVSGGRRAAEWLRPVGSPSRTQRRRYLSLAPCRCRGLVDWGLVPGAPWRLPLQINVRPCLAWVVGLGREGGSNLKPDASGSRLFGRCHGV
jgi:hypothetical protein